MGKRILIPGIGGDFETVLMFLGDGDMIENRREMVACEVSEGYVRHEVDAYRDIAPDLTQEDAEEMVRESLATERLAWRRSVYARVLRFYEQNGPFDAVVTADPYVDIVANCLEPFVNRRQGNLSAEFVSSYEPIPLAGGVWIPGSKVVPNGPYDAVLLPRVLLELARHNGLPDAAGFMEKLAEVCKPGAMAMAYDDQMTDIWQLKRDRRLPDARAIYNSVCEGSGWRVGKVFENVPLTTERDHSVAYFERR